MNIALIGSGGREHALCQKIYESKLCSFGTGYSGRKYSLA